MARSTAKPSQKNARARKARASTSLEPARPTGKKRAIDLYYWPTPNGWKITIMLEECSLPYTMIPVDISKGDQWLFWQMANLGPKAGEANHFRNYAPEKLPYAIERFSNEMNRIYGVMNTRLKDREFLAGNYSIADIASVGWASRAERHGHDMSGFPNVRRWPEAVLARPAVKRGLSVKVEAAFHVDMKDPKVRAILFHQKAR